MLTHERFAYLAEKYIDTVFRVAFSYLKSREKKEMQLTVRSAIDKGQPLPAELIDALTMEAQGESMKELALGEE